MKTPSALLAAATILAFVVPASPTSSFESPVPSLPWLHEGLVLTFTWYAAKTAGNGSIYQEDGQGGWVDTRTGRHLSRFEQHGTAGSGWNQVTIAGIDGGNVVVSVSAFNNAGALGRNQPVPTLEDRSAVAPAGNPGEYWMDPAKLASMHTNTAQRLLVTHVPWKTGDHTTDAIRVQIIKEDAYDEHVYDAKTGICLHMAGSVRGAPPKYVGPGDMGQGDTVLSHGDFVGARDISVPWAREAMPAWVSGVHALHYRGPIISHGPLPSGNSFCFADLEIIAHGRGWVKLVSTSGFQTQGAPRTPPSKAEFVFGRSQFEGLWAGPVALAALHKGQVLDEDPITRMQTLVARADDRSVVISSRNAAGEIDSEYDRQTGMRIGYSFYDVMSQRQLTLRLQGRE